MARDYYSNSLLYIYIHNEWAIVHLLSLNLNLPPTESKASIIIHKSLIIFLLYLKKQYLKLV